MFIQDVWLSFFQGPFTTFKVENEAKEDWTGLKFSPDGKMIMITTNGSSVTLIDSFKGTLVHVLRGLFNYFDNAKFKIIQIILCGLDDSIYSCLFDGNDISQAYNALQDRIYSFF